MNRFTMTTACARTNAGNPIQFRMVTNTGNTVRERVGAIIQDDPGGYRDRRDLRDHRLRWEHDPHSGITLWHSGENLHLWHPNQPEPATAWEAELDDIYVKASQELDHDRRVEYYHRAQEIVTENVPLIFTTLGERIIAVRQVSGNTTATLYGWTDTRYPVPHRPVNPRPNSSASPFNREALFLSVHGVAAIATVGVQSVPPVCATKRPDSGHSRLLYRARDPSKRGIRKSANPVATLPRQ